MTTCPYCSRPATATIVANPHRVCPEHAVEFWTGLLDYTRGRSAPCSRHEQACTCPLCEETQASRLQTAAILGVSPAPGDHVDFGMRLAS